MFSIQPSFFTPIQYGNKAASKEQTILEKVDSYFYFGGRKVQIVDARNDTGLINEGKAPTIGLSIAKIVSYCTIVIPLLMLIAKTVLRNRHHFQIIDITEVESANKLYAFYKTREILIGKEKIEDVNIDELGLDLTEKAIITFKDTQGSQFKKEERTLRTAVEDMIIDINNAISYKASMNTPASIKEIRHILIGTRGMTGDYFRDTIPEGTGTSTDDEENQRWPVRIAAALVKKGYLFSSCRKGQGIEIQA